MEEKQLNLNFNQPLLSARRYTTVTSQEEDRHKTDNSRPVVPPPPLYKSELKSGPVTNPGAVPFIWEQTPGRPKDGIKPRTQNYDRPPIAPKLPPGRYPTVNVKPNREDSNNVSSRDSKTSITVNMHHESQTGPSLDETSKSVDNNKEEKTEEKGSSDSGESDEAYVDALDTLSRPESFFLNCSVTGVSGLEDFDSRSSRRFSTDQQAREFMMDRFLPAAKAMVSEAPHHTPRKQPVVREQPQEPKKTVVNPVKPSLRYGPSFAKRYSYYQSNEYEEESDDEYEQQHGNSYPSVCGLLPRFCLKSSLGFLNPIPAMSVRTRMPTSPVDRVKTRSSSYSSGSFSETEMESKPDPKSLHNVRTEEDKVRHGSSPLQNHSNLTSCESGDSPWSFHEEKEIQEKISGVKGLADREGFKTFKELFLIEDKEIQSKNYRTEGLEPDGKGLKTFEELLAEQESPEELDLDIPVVEKTLYVDTEQKVEPPFLKSSSPKLEDDYESLSKSMNQLNITNTEPQDFDKSHSVDEEVKKLLLNTKNLADFSIISPINEANVLMAVGDIQVADKISMENDVKSVPIAKVPPENPRRKRLDLPTPPPLPKSPSDSWLWRTLPSVSTKSAATNTRTHVVKVGPGEMKWEAIVKSSKVRRQSLRHTEDLLTPIPET